MCIIKASDIANFNFCQRVFWYSMNGYKPENHEFMVNGVVHHTRLTRKINFSRITRIIALGLAAIGILAFVLDILIS
ncbi:MAG: hypothetical protein ACK2TU_09370 [Anaerolineales bacterium]|jgi:hypothetical protein